MSVLIDDQYRNFVKGERSRPGPEDVIPARITQAVSKFKAKVVKPIHTFPKKRKKGKKRK